MMNEIIYSPSDLAAAINMTLEGVYPSVLIEGELSNYKVSKNRWVYFDLKDNEASIRFFGTVYQLSGPLEDGMMVRVRGVPRLHPRFGFSVSVINISPTGEGSIKKAEQLLEKKLTAEGLFDPQRKRPLPVPPLSVGLITSSESAAYSDFLKILNNRWSGVSVHLYDVAVQGEEAVEQITEAINYFNSGELVEVLVLIRGGGSVDDLAVFSNEQVTRAVASSRTPTLVAIGHERDTSLAELAADSRASTPSNAAELLFIDKKDVMNFLSTSSDQLYSYSRQVLKTSRSELAAGSEQLHKQTKIILNNYADELKFKTDLLEALSPVSVLRRGYAIIRSNNQLVRSVKKLDSGTDISIELHDGLVNAKVKDKL